ncbi:MAG: hypothetical protein ACU837_11905 [Gammaproteobacteria bacterium]
MSFFEAYAKLLSPNCERPKEDGDYYCSPLQYLGLKAEQAYRIDPAWMCHCQKVNGKVEHNLISMGDEEYVYIDERYKEKLSKFDRTGAEYLLKQKNYMPDIFVSEALLQIFHDENSPKTEKDFFENAYSYFSYHHNSDTYALDEYPYKFFLTVGISLLWAEYKKRGLLLPSKPCIEDSPPLKVYTTPTKDEKHEVAYKDIFKAYDSLYQFLYKNKKSNERMNRYIDAMLNAYISGKEKPTKSVFYAIGLLPKFMRNYYYVSFNSEPWKYFFRKHHNRRIVYDKNIDDKDTFGFYDGHPGNGKFWETLFLVDLHEHLRDENNENGRSWISGHPSRGGPGMGIAGSAALAVVPGFATNVLAGLLTSPKLFMIEHTNSLTNELPLLSADAFELAEQVRSHLSTSIRYVHAKGKTMAQSQKTNLPNPYFMSRPDKNLFINEPQKDSSSWTIELRIPEDKLYETSGEAMILDFTVAYYHQNKYELIPCELIGEKPGTKDNPTAIFTLAINKWDCSSADLNPKKTDKMAGFSGAQGIGDIVVLFSD